MQPIESSDGENFMSFIKFSRIEKAIKHFPMPVAGVFAWKVKILFYRLILKNLEVDDVMMEVDGWNWQLNF
jgi:hypothetical protein